MIGRRKGLGKVVLLVMALGVFGAVWAADLVVSLTEPVSCYVAAPTATTSTCVNWDKAGISFNSSSNVLMIEPSVAFNANDNLVVTGTVPSGVVLHQVAINKGSNLGTGMIIWKGTVSQASTTPRTKESFMTVSDGGTSFALDSGSIVANHGVALTVTTGALNIGNSSTAGTPAGNTAGGIRVETKKGTAIEVNGNVTIGRPNITDGMSRRTVNIVAGDSFYVASSLSKMDGTAIKAADVLIQRSATATIEAKDGYAIEAGDVTIQRNGSVSVTVAAGNKTEMHAINAAGDVTIGKNLNVDESVNSDTANIVIRTASPSKNAENLTYAVYAPSGKVIVSAPSNVASLTIEATGAGSKAIYTDADDIFINGKVYAVGAPHPVGTTGGIINIAGRAGALYSEAGDVKLSSFASPSTIGNNVRLGVTAEGGYVIEAVEGAVNMDSVVVSQPAAGVATVGVPVYFVRAKGDVVLEGAVVTVPANDKLQAVIYGESDVIVKAKVFVG